MMRSLWTAHFVEKDRTQFLAHLPEIEVCGPSLGCDDQIDPLREAAHVQSVELPDEPLDSVPLDSVSGSLARRDPQPVRTRPAPTHRDRKMFSVDFPAGAI